MADHPPRPGPLLRYSLAGPSMPSSTGLLPLSSMRPSVVLAVHSPGPPAMLDFFSASPMHSLIGLEGSMSTATSPPCTTKTIATFGGEAGGDSAPGSERAWAGLGAPPVLGLCAGFWGLCKSALFGSSTVIPWLENGGHNNPATLALGPPCPGSAGGRAGDARGLGPFGAIMTTAARQGAGGRGWPPVGCGCGALLGALTRRDLGAADRRWARHSDSPSRRPRLEAS